MPVAAAASLLYCSAVLMMTRPGSTLARMACSLALVPELLPLLGWGIAALGSGAGALAEGCADAELLLGGGVIQRHHRARAQGAGHQRHQHVAQRSGAAPGRPRRHGRHRRGRPVRRLAVTAVILHRNHAFARGPDSSAPVSARTW